MFNTHLRGRVWFRLLFTIVFIFPLINSNDRKQLTLYDQKTFRSLLFVSTLDGKISALDVSNLGKKQWTLDFNEGPMLSSNIHYREFNDNGKRVYFIPSLSGGLYKLDKENLEAVPVSATQLIQSSFRYSDDLVLSGGREVKSYGVSSTTGKILYECGINGCTNNTEGESYIERDVLIVQRFQQTVRAVEPRTGHERWNFSVGQHELVLVPNSDTYCHNEIAAHIRDIEIKVVVPDGLIWAVNKNNPTVKLWQYKFDSPIVTIWREHSNTNNGHKYLKEVNLFDSMQWSWGTEFSINPGIYLGKHGRQLYVQENTELYKSLEQSLPYIQSSKYPLQLYPAIGDEIIRTLPVPEDNDPDNNALLQINDVQSTTALSEYITDSGFYLYSKDQLQLDNNKQCNRTNSNSTITEENERPFRSNNTGDEDDDTPVQVIIVSLWYWWKEVLIISITTAILLNFMLTQRLLNATTVAKDAVLPPLIVERHIETNTNNPKTINDKETIDSFTSRYLTDFVPVDCLGKGGYGVVFEAKNKIDDCNYAIKRIALPNSQSSRERVMREVKALAKLDHQNIVRYFNAWLECPPAGWQEKHDLEWMNRLALPNLECISDGTPIGTKVNNSVCITVSQTDQSSIESASEAYDALNHYDSDEDSFIVFEPSDSHKPNENVIDMSKCSTESLNLSISIDTGEEIMPSIDDVTRSQSIVFENVEGGNHSEKEENRKRQRSFSLDLNNKASTRKFPKMLLYIQMQLCQRLSLREWLKNQSTRDCRRVLNIFQQIVEAVEYVHLQGLIHRDLKPSNIFFSFDDKIKVGDFGLVTAMTEGYGEVHTPTSENENTFLKNNLHTANVGTRLYMSPEQINGLGYNYKVDIYSLGIILFELLIPFTTEMERVTALMNLRKSVFPKDFNIDHPAEYDLLKMMLDKNPSNRPTTIGIKAKPPLFNYEIANGLTINEDTKWHFDLPQILRHSSVTNSSSGESWENIT